MVYVNMIYVKQSPQEKKKKQAGSIKLQLLNLKAALSSGADLSANAPNSFLTTAAAAKWGAVVEQIPQEPG